ncbi:hypothetical protein KDX24_12110, partial [Pseudomonas sp. CDFA 550]
LGVGEGHLFHHRKARRLVFRDFAKSGSLFQSFLRKPRLYNIQTMLIFPGFQQLVVPALRLSDLARTSPKRM